VPITTNVVSSNPAYGEVYSIQHYMIKFVNDLPQVDGFLRVLQKLHTNKNDRHDITEILLQVALNTTTITSIWVRLDSLIFSLKLLSSVVFNF